MTKAALAAALIFCVSAAAAAQESKDSPEADASVTDAKDEVVCQRVKVTGTRLKSKRVCHTKAHWEEIARLAEEDWRNTQRSVNVQKGD